MTGWMIVVTAIAAGIPSLAKMVEGIVRLRVMQKAIKATIEKCSQGEISSALHALADVGSSLAPEMGQGARLLGLPYLRRRSIDQGDQIDGLHGLGRSSAHDPQDERERLARSKLMAENRGLSR